MTSNSETNKVSVDDDTYERLQRVINEVKEKETDLKTWRERIDDEDGLVAQYQVAQELAIKIEEHEIKCRNYKNQIEMVQKLILSKRRIIHEVQDKIDKKNQDKEKLKERTEGLALQAAENALTKTNNKSVTEVLNKLVSYRKIYLLQEVMELFKIDIDGGPASVKRNRPKTDCKCVLVDTIRGLHLPHVASIQLSPHNEKETTAAIGLLFQLLDIISRILGYSLSYPVFPAASFSKIYCPAEDKWAVLSGWKKRSERERFFEGLTWLGKNIAQLRSDCGTPIPMADKTLSVLAEWIRSVIEGKYVCTYERPIDNSSSPASLLINFQQMAEALPVDPVL